MLNRWRRRPQEPQDDRVINGVPLAQTSDETICHIVIELMRELARRSNVSLTRECEIMLSAVEAYDQVMDERMGL